MAVFMKPFVGPRHVARDNTLLGYDAETSAPIYGTAVYAVSAGYQILAPYYEVVAYSYTSPEEGTPMMPYAPKALMPVSGQPMSPFDLESLRYGWAPPGGAGALSPQPSGSINLRNTAEQLSFLRVQAYVANENARLRVVAYRDLLQATGSQFSAAREAGFNLAARIADLTSQAGDLAAESASMIASLTPAETTQAALNMIGLNATAAHDSNVEAVANVAAITGIAPGFNFSNAMNAAIAANNSVAASIGDLNAALVAFNLDPSNVNTQEAISTALSIALAVAALADVTLSTVCNEANAAIADATLSGALSGVQGLDAQAALAAALAAECITQFTGNVADDDGPPAADASADISDGAF
jgi:hypothetical protein